MLGVSVKYVLRSMKVGPDVPAVSIDPGTYRVSAEKSRPFNGKFRIVLAVRVVPSVALLVFKIGAAAETFIVVEAVPTVNLTLKFAVCKTSRLNAGMVSLLKPAACTVTS